LETGPVKRTASDPADLIEPVSAKKKGKPV
jgi:hypothetical protein